MIRGAGWSNGRCNGPDSCFDCCHPGTRWPARLPRPLLVVCVASAWQRNRCMGTMLPGGAHPAELAVHAVGRDTVTAAPFLLQGLCPAAATAVSIHRGWVNWGNCCCVQIGSGAVTRWRSSARVQQWRQSQLNQASADSGTQQRYISHVMSAEQHNSCIQSATPGDRYCNKQHNSSSKQQKRAAVL